MGEVIRKTIFGCCSGVTTGLGPTYKGGNVPVCLGCGCEAAKVLVTNDELQARDAGRGNIAQLRPMESMLGPRAGFPVLLRQHGTGT